MVFRVRILVPSGKEEGDRGGASGDVLYLDPGSG